MKVSSLQFDLVIYMYVFIVEDSKLKKILGDKYNEMTSVVDRMRLDLYNVA